MKKSFSGYFRDVCASPFETGTACSRGSICSELDQTPITDTLAESIIAVFGNRPVLPVSSALKHTTGHALYIQQVVHSYDTVKLNYSLYIQHVVHSYDTVKLNYHYTYSTSCILMIQSNSTIHYTYSTSCILMIQSNSTIHYTYSTSCILMIQSNSTIHYTYHVVHSYDTVKLNYTQ